MRISKKIDWCMAHRLPNHDGHCRNLHGHQYVLEVVVEGPVSKKNGSGRGMVADFGELKQLLQKQVHDICDHSCMVANDDKILVDFYKKNPDLKHVNVAFDSSAENIADWIFAKLEKGVEKLGPSIQLYSVQVWETAMNSALVVKGRK